MCKRNGESVNRLFLHCPFASDLWSMVLGLFGVSWVMPRTVLVLARQLWLSSKWLYLVHHSSLLIVVSLEGAKKDVLKILRDLFRTSSFSFLGL